MRNLLKIDICDLVNWKFEVCCIGLGNNEKIMRKLKNGILLKIDRNDYKMIINGFIDVYLLFFCVVFYIS